MEQYVAHAFIVSGVLLIVAAILFHRVANLVFLFLGIGFIFSGSVVLLETMIETWVCAFLLGVIFIGGLIIVFWKPLKDIQEKTKHSHIDSELHQKQFVLDADVNITSEWEYHHSGINWKVKSVEPLLKGTLVRIERIENGTLWVSAI
ncbi:hypothetical protein CBF23_014325 [Marinomonas agarivorans]|nr:hypothetical protein CBF23_014325 [Marinomonas agarivorans]